MKKNTSMRFETRKLQKTGVSTITMSLPKSWVRKNKLAAGNEVTVDEGIDGGLIVRKATAKKDELVLARVVEVGETESFTEFERILLANYLAGFEKIVLLSKKGFSENLRGDILRVVRTLMSLEVVEEDNNRIVLQDFFSVDYLSLEKALRRAFNINSLLLKDLFSGIGVSKTKELEKEIDRLHLLVRRQLGLALASSAKMQSLGMTTDKCIIYLLIISSIEEIADTIEKISGAIQKLKANHKKIIDKFSKLCADIYERHILLPKTLFGGEITSANKLIEGIKKINNSLNVLSQQFFREESANAYLGIQEIVYNLREILRNMEEIAEAIVDSYALQSTS